MNTLINQINADLEQGQVEFNANQKHYDLAQSILKRTTPITDEVKDAAYQVLMSFVNKSRATRINMDIVQLLQSA